MSKKLTLKGSQTTDAYKKQVSSDLAKSLMAKGWTQTGGTWQPPAAASPTTPPAGSNFVSPFYSPQQLMDLANFKGGQDTQYADIDGRLRQLAADVTYGKSVNDRGAQVSSSNANDELAARGLGQSSIRDGDLADIEGNRIIQNTRLDTQLQNARTTAEASKTALVNQATTFMKGMDQGAVDNADSINSQIIPDAPAAPAIAPGPPKVVSSGPQPSANGAPQIAHSGPQPTTSGGPASTIVASWPGFNSAGQGGTFHRHSDGKTVFVKG